MLRHRSTEDVKPLVEILYFRGCPNHADAHALVERLAAELRLDPEIRDVEVPDPEAAPRFRFLGSPTVRVDGEDVAPGTEGRTDYVFACRIYRGEHGLSGQPDEQWIREALEAAAVRA
jgi:hypothetical protein